MELSVTDVPERSRYQVTDGDRVLGTAAYERRGGRIVFTHTEVDPDQEGAGVGSTLVRGALDDARARGLRVLPLCPFVRRWIDRHPDYADLVDAPG